MNCPYCGKPMEDGTLYHLRNDTAMVWLPLGVKMPLIYSETKIQDNGGLLLGRDTKWTLSKIGGVHVPLSVCRTCKKGILTIE